MSLSRLSSAAAVVPPEEVGGVIGSFESACGAVSDHAFDSGVFEAARADLVETAERALEDPAFWAWHMANARYHGISISEIARAADAYGEITAEAARLELRKALREGSVFRVVATP